MTSAFYLSQAGHEVGDDRLQMQTVDVARLIDEGRFSPYQQRLVAAAALLIVLDGADNQLLANAIPAMMREWDLPRPAFATASAAAPFGMILGGLLGGILGDRIGRSTALLGSVTWFAALTALVAFADGLTTLTVVRFLAGLGLGGAMPNAAALTAEFVPARQRPIAITLTIVCIPVGGVLAGLAAGAVIPAYGWRALFAAGGLVPLALALMFFKMLPESPSFLAGVRQRWPELRATLRRMGHIVQDDVTFVDPAGAIGAPRGSIADLFAPALRRDTLALIGAFGSCLLAIWMAFLWIPAMLTDPAVGFAQPEASFALSMYNFGGVGGAIAGALLIQRIGSRVALLTISALAVVSALAMARMPLRPDALNLLMVMFAVSGALFNAVQATMYALAAHVFPTAIRGTGVGATVAVGRLGNVAASYVGSWALTTGGPPLYFQMWAGAMGVVFICLALIRRHIQRA
jgi:AAHS family 4-hydroxybenzoate transporter-like MFS transporter